MTRQERQKLGMPAAGDNEKKKDLPEMIQQEENTISPPAAGVQKDRIRLPAKGGEPESFRFR